MLTIMKFLMIHSEMQGRRKNRATLSIQKEILSFLVFLVSWDLIGMTNFHHFGHPPVKMCYNIAMADDSDQAPPPEDNPEEKPVPAEQPTPVEEDPTPPTEIEIPPETTEVLPPEPIKSEEPQPKEEKPKPIEEKKPEEDKPSEEKPVEVVQEPESPSIDDQVKQKLDEKVKELLQKANEKRKQNKQDHLNKLAQFVKDKKVITNSDARDLLHVSKTSATNYLNDLVKSGKLKREGKWGDTRYSA